MRISPTKLLHGLLYMTPVLLLTLAACGGGGGGDSPPTLASAYTLSVNVTGVSGVAVLRNNGGDDLTVTTDGTHPFTTKVISGTSYNVTVLSQPSAQLCTVTGPTGTMPASNKTVAVSCVTAYTIGGTITGAASGIGPILQNNLGDNLFIPTVASGVPVAFTFNTPVADGAAYAVTQLVHARAPAQDCSTITGGGVGNDGTGTVSGANVTNVAITCTLSTATAKFAYVANSTFNTSIGAADVVSAYTIASSGVLAASTPPTTASGDGAYAVAVDPTGQFAYVVNGNADSVSAYAVDSVTGALTAIDANGAVTGTQASIATGDFPISIAIDPSGQFVYVANQGNGTSTGNTLSVYSLDVLTGALSAIDANDTTVGTQATIATGTLPYAVTVDPLGKFVYVANYFSNNISVYKINLTTGALTAGAAVAAGTDPASIAVDPTGKCALVANNTSNDVYSYTINSTTGALTAKSSAVASGYVGSAPRSVAIDPNTGQYAYVTNAAAPPAPGPGPGPVNGSVSAFNVATDCTIASIDTDAVTVGVNTTIAAGTTPFSINVDPSGQFVYVANFGSDNISVYSIGAGGALTELAGSPFTTASGPTSVTTTQ